MIESVENKIPSDRVENQAQEGGHLGDENENRGELFAKGLDKMRHLSSDENEKRDGIESRADADEHGRDDLEAGRTPLSVYRARMPDVLLEPGFGPGRRGYRHYVEHE